MKKRIESLKTFILFGLVGLSMLLSYQIWTFKFDYETIENEKYIEKVSIGEKKSIDDIIQPRSTFVHINGSHYSVSQIEADYVLKVLRSWEVLDVKKSDTSFTYTDFFNRMNTGVSLQIAFPNEVSNLFLNGLFSKVQSDDLDFSFRNIILYLDAGKEGKLYFINEVTGQTFEGILKQNNIDELEKSLQTINENKIKVEPFQFHENRLFYLPSEGFYLERFIFLTEQLDSELFRDALFTNPKYVKQSGEEDNVFYTDGTRLLQKKNENHSLVYVNPLNVQIKNQASQKFQFESYNYVNGHGGFTGDYYLSDVLESNRQVIFRMHYNGLPIFGKDLCTAIEVRWGDDESLSYIHPSYQLSYQIEQEKTPVFIDSGQTVYNQLMKNPNINSQLIENIRISYVMDKENRSGQLVYLSPTWVVLYDGKWVELDTLLQGDGGEISGLE